MADYDPGCMGHYDFDQIARYAYKRFVEGCDTVTLMQTAKNQREKEEIALVALMDVHEDTIRSMQISCRYAEECKITNCHEKLRQILGKDYFGSDEKTAGDP